VLEIDHGDARRRREEFFRRNRRLAVALGVVLGVVLVLGFRLFRTQPHRGTGPTAWVVPVAAIAGTVILASLPPEWEPLAWGIFSGGLLAMIAGILQVRRRLVRDDELFVQAEREAGEA